MISTAHPLLRFWSASLAALLVVLTLIATPAPAQEAYFEMDTLNSGLPAPPEGMDRSTPMGAVESFLYRTRRSEFSQAAHLLDLSDIDVGDQVATGEELARQLYVLMDRKVVIPWDSLSDRPDGWLSGTSDNDATGRIRRSVRLDWLDLDNHGVPLRLNRVKPGDAPPVWVFARQSVANIPDLFERYGPTSLEMALPSWARGRAFWGMYVW